MALPNIYEMKHYKLLIIIPIAMLLVSLFFIPKIQLDQSLKGGVNIQLQTNSTIDVRALTSAIDSRIPGAQASVSLSLGGVSITIDANTSLTQASSFASKVDSAYGNYTGTTVNLASYQAALKTQPNNQTLINVISGAAG